MIAIIDYGAGNLFSVKNALDFLKIPNEITSEANKLEEAQAIILPGVGAFPDAMHMLQNKGLIPVIQDQAQKKPLLGICLGMQILFEKGYEFNETQGLGLIPGNVIKIDGGGLKIPHIGWNDLKISNHCSLTKETREGDFVYFVHSFRADTEEKYISCYTMYHEKIPALVQHGHVYGAQFHPEKSGTVGLAMLKNFAGLVEQ